MTTEQDVRTVGILRFEHSAQVVLQADDDERDSNDVTISFVSERPMRRWFGDVIVSLDEGAMDDSRVPTGSVPFLDNHDSGIGFLSSGRGTFLGQVQKTYIEGEGDARRAYADLRFSRNGLPQQVKADMLDGLRNGISPGIMPLKMVLEEENEDGADLYRITQWELLEISSALIPANPDVGVVFAEEEDEKSREYIQGLIDEARSGSIETQEPEVLNRETPEQEVEMPEDRVAQLVTLGQEHGWETEALAAISTEETPEEFRDRMRSIHIRNDDPPDDGGEIGDGFRYSIGRVAKALAFPRDRKLQQAAEKDFRFADMALGDGEIGRERQANGLFVPAGAMWDGVQRDERGNRLTEEFTSTTTTAADLIQTEVDHDNYIGLLIERGAILGRCRVMPGLVGPVNIPRIDSGLTLGYVTEGAQQAESDPTFSDIELRPKILSAAVKMTNMSLHQTAGFLERYIREALTMQWSSRINRDLLRGEGTNNRPRGVLTIPSSEGINEVEFTANTVPTWQNYVDVEKEIIKDLAPMNALYILDPELYAAAKYTEKATGTAEFIYQNGSINGFPAMKTTHMPAETGIFGDWSEAYVGFWAGMDMVVDQVTDPGNLKLTFFQWWDVQFGHASSFCLLDEA